VLGKQKSGQRQYQNDNYIRGQFERHWSRPIEFTRPNLVRVDIMPAAINTTPPKQISKTKAKHRHTPGNTDGYGGHIGRPNQRYLLGTPKFQKYII